MSAYVLRKIKIDSDALSEAVAAVATESAVEAWLAAHAELSDVEKLNQRISSVTIGMLGPESLALMGHFYDNIDQRPKSETVFELLEADDSRLG